MVYNRGNNNKTVGSTFTLWLSGTKVWTSRAMNRDVQQEFVPPTNIEFDEVRYEMSAPDQNFREIEIFGKAKVGDAEVKNHNLAFKVYDFAGNKDENNITKYLEVTP